MAYQINLTNGTAFATIADGTLNTSSSMILVGKNYPGYGAFLDTNFIHLLENAANSTAPAAPLSGQLWFNTTTKIIQVWNGTAWKSLGGATASSSAPSNNNTGDLWYDTINQQLNVYTGNSFILVGPQFTSATGITGAIPTTLTDTLGSTHTVVQLTTANSVVAMVSKDATFTPGGIGVPGFSNVRPGITLANTISGVTQQFWGTANNAQQLNGLTSSDFVRNSGTTQTMSVGLNVLNDTGLGVGVNQDLRMSVSSGTITIQNQTQNGNVVFRVNQGGVATTVLTLDGANASVNFGNSISVGNIAKTGSNAVGNIGSSTNYFNRVFATATTALYADVAERFAADDVYAAGTVVCIGGSREITAVNEDASENVLGVISSQAAFLMNGGAGEDDTHPPVAVTGRVPVRVRGTVCKGDRLVSAGHGLARSALPGEATAFNTIGRSLVDKTSDDEGTVEAIVMIK
jgi:hypothetical protein